ncbi:hypothetical protein [Aureivirga marina]|uniref:hypothetical protein n=1 Tax=Aureivirga marina TaxID=1182451 RepID=UPI0018CAF6E1|nr:hypothetical protein [Aureivirga marina]
MDLDTMKKNWEKLSDEIEKQKSITDKLIIDMTKEKYNNNLRRILVPEIIGAIICFSAAIYALIHFDRLDTWYFQILGVLFLISLIIFPMIVLRSIFSLSEISIGNGTSKEMIDRFIQKRKNLLLVQKITAVSNFVLLFTTLPVTSKVMNNKDIFLEPMKLILFVLIMGTFLFFFTTWYLKSLKKKTQNMQKMLEDLAY